MPINAILSIDIYVIIGYYIEAIQSPFRSNQMTQLFCTIARPAGHSEQRREYRLLSKSHGFASITPKNLRDNESGAGFEIELSKINSAWIITPSGDRLEVNINPAQDYGSDADWRDQKSMYEDLRRGG